MFIGELFDTLPEHEKVAQDPSYDPAEIVVLTTEEASLLQMEYCNVKTDEEFRAVNEKYNIPRSKLAYYVATEKEKDTITNEEIWDNLINREIALLSRQYQAIVIEDGKENWNSDWLYFSKHTDKMIRDYDEKTKEYVVHSETTDLQGLGYNPLAAVKDYIKQLHQFKVRN